MSEQDPIERVRAEIERANTETRVSVAPAAEQLGPIRQTAVGLAIAASGILGGVAAVATVAEQMAAGASKDLRSLARRISQTSFNDAVQRVSRRRIF